MVFKSELNKHFQRIPDQPSYDSYVLVDQITNQEVWVSEQVTDSNPRNHHKVTGPVVAIHHYLHTTRGVRGKHTLCGSVVFGS